MGEEVPTKIVVTPSTFTINPTETRQLTVTPAIYSYTWSSSNTAVATVSSTGLVRGMSGGTATISVKYRNKQGRATVTVQGSSPPPPDPPPSINGRGPNVNITCPLGAVSIPAGSSIQNAINANPTGTVFCLGTGMHSISAAILPKSGNQFYGQYGAILDGAGWAFTGDLQTGAFKAHNSSIIDVIIKNLVIQHMPMRAIHAFNGPDNWLVEYCNLNYNRQGFRIAANSQVKHCNIFYNKGDDTNPDTNYHGGAYQSYQSVNCLVDDNEMAFNGPTQKFFESTDITFTNNYIHDSDHAIWHDGCDGGVCRGNTISNCRVGLEFEISRSGILDSNIIQNCSQAAVFISCSYTVDTYGNNITNCLHGIQYFLDCSRINEPGHLFLPDLHDCSSHDNVITMNSSGTLASALSLLGSTCNPTQIALYTGGSKNLTFQSNRYFVPSLSSSIWQWGTANKNWTQWQALGRDTTGSLNLL